MAVGRHLPETVRRIGSRVAEAQGAALLGVITMTLVLAVVVAALTAALMAELGTGAASLAGQQAVAAAEAGAYRALAELRRRVRVDLPARVGAAALPVVAGICRAAEGARASPVDLLVRYALPPGQVASDWRRVGDTAYLDIGTPGRPVRLHRAGDAAAWGEVYATVAVRWSQRPTTCQGASAAGALERYVFWFDHAVVAVGRVGAARRVVCLRSAGADVCARWFPEPSAAWRGSHVLTGGTTGGWAVVVAELPAAAGALTVLGDSTAWLASGTRIEGGVHANRDLGIAGTPEVAGPVRVAGPSMRFYACGWPRSLEIPDDADEAALTVPGCDAPRFLGPVRGGNQGVRPAPDPTTLPPVPNPARQSLGLTPVAGPDPTAEEVRAATSDLADGAEEVPPGVYVADRCGPPGAGCGGIYVAGNVRSMWLVADDAAQRLDIQVERGPGTPALAVRVLVDPVTGAVEVVDPEGRRTYPPGTFNGVVYVAGAITAPYDPDADGSLDDPDVGLRGVLHPQVRLTVVAAGGITVTDHVVAPPAPEAANGAGNSRGLLGLYARGGDVTVAGPLAPRDLFVDAAVLAPQGRLWVDPWDRLPEKGTLTVVGAVVARTLGPVGGFDPPAGYRRIHVYDPRLRMVVPPAFPRTGTVGAVDPVDGDPAFADGDVLYGRPLWEELVAR
jgi:hypothetical protein